MLLSSAGWCLVSCSRTLRLRRVAQLNENSQIKSQHSTDWQAALVEKTGEKQLHYNWKMVAVKKRRYGQHLRGKNPFLCLNIWALFKFLKGYHWTFTDTEEGKFYAKVYLRNVADTQISSTNYLNVVKDHNKQDWRRGEGGRCVCAWVHMKSDDVVDSLSAGCQSIN